MATKREELVYTMLTTSTGAALCDSGGAYGRHWERNQKKTLEDFQKEPQVSFEVNAWRPEGDTSPTTSKDIEYTVSLFHYLTSDGFSLDDVCNEYNALPCEDWESDIYGVSREQKDWIDSKGFSVERDFNTYNEDCPLSQTLQGTIIKERDGVEYYVLLQVHNGCDVRGGYTDAKLFKLEDGWLPRWDVYGSIDGQPVSTAYDGTNLLHDETYEAVPVTEKSKVRLFL